MESTSRVHPISEITSLLQGDVEREDESPSAEKQEEALESTDENLEAVDSQSSDKSLSEPEDESPQEGIESLNNLADELDVPIEDMYALGMNIPKSKAFPDGGNITLGELKDFYTKNVNIDQEREALTQRETALQEQSEQVSDVPRVSNELLQARAQVLAIQDAYNRTDWNGLRHANPAEFAALQQDFRTQFEAAKGQEALTTQQFEDHRQETQRIQRERLFEIMPDLKDDKILTDTVVQVTEYAKKYGVTAKEIDEIQDHRVMRMLIDASRSESAKVTGKEKQVVKKAPVTSKPAVAKSLPGRKAALKRLTEKARQSGQRRDQVKAVTALLNE